MFPRSIPNQETRINVDELHKVCEMLLGLIIHSPHAIKLNRMVISVLKTKRLVSTSLVMIITAVVDLANFDISLAKQITSEQRTQICDPKDSGRKV